MVNGNLPSIPTQRTAVPTMCRGGRTSLSRLHRRLLPAASTRLIFTARLVPPPLRVAPARRTGPALAALRRCRLLGNRLDQRRLCRRSPGRLHAVHVSISPTLVHGDTMPKSSCGPKTTRTISRSRAANRIGSWSRIPSGIRARPASGRRSGWRRCRRRASRRIAFTPDLARWEIGVEAWLDGDRRADALRLSVKLRSGATLLAADTLSGRQRRSPSRHRAVGSGHRRLAQRAALESARAESDRRRAGTVGRARRSCSITFDSYTALRTVARRAIAFCSTAGRICCAWCSTRAIGRRRRAPRRTMRR